MGDQLQQRLLARVGPDHPVAGIVQHGLENLQVLRLVIDDQNVDLLVDLQQVFAVGEDGAHRNSQTRISESSWSVLTGLAM